MRAIFALNEHPCVSALETNASRKLKFDIFLAVIATNYYISTLVYQTFAINKHPVTGQIGRSPPLDSFRVRWTSANSGRPILAQKGEGTDLWNDWHNVERRITRIRACLSVEENYAIAKENTSSTCGAVCGTSSNRERSYSFCHSYNGFHPYLGIFFPLQLSTPPTLVRSFFVPPNWVS